MSRARVAIIYCRSRRWESALSAARPCHVLPFTVRSCIYNHDTAHCICKVDQGVAITKYVDQLLIRYVFSYLLLYGRYCMFAVQRVHYIAYINRA